MACVSTGIFKLHEVIIHLHVQILSAPPSISTFTTAAAHFKASKPVVNFTCQLTNEGKFSLAVLV